MLREVEQMSGESAKLEVFTDEERRVVQHQAERRGISAQACLREGASRALESFADEQGTLFVNPRTGVVCRLPENPKSIMDLVGMISDPDVTGENFDDYLYGRAGT